MEDRRRLVKTIRRETGMDSGLTRRQILQAGVAAGAVALSADPLVQLAQAAKTKPLGKLTDIEHVIILIQENRSFDHYFGTYSGVEGFGDAGAKAIFEQEGYPAPGFEGKLLPFHLETGGKVQCFPDITHSWQPQHHSWDGGAMDNFVRTHLEIDGSQAGPATMGYYEQSDIPFYRALANTFTICDQYFCSVLGPTDPNRLYSLSGTIDPDGLNGGPLLQTLLKGDPRATGKFTWTTMPEQLSSAGVSWKMYTGTGGGLEDNVLPYFKNFQTNPALANLAFKPTYPKGFKHDLVRGELPQVSWINTSLSETEHPGNSTAKVGEHAVAELLKMLMNHKAWQKTALFITWDENGGFFDHVAPPTAPTGTAGEYLTAPDISGDADGVTGPIGLGFRVPMIVASPFTRGGLVCSDTFDHTSMLRFIETRFGVEVPNLSTWRRAQTDDLTSAFNFAAPPNLKKPSLPTVELLAGEGGGGCSTSAPVTVPPNSYPTQEPGVRAHPSGIV
jgi:phospholipase C